MENEKVIVIDEKKVLIWVDVSVRDGLKVFRKKNNLKNINDGVEKLLEYYNTTVADFQQDKVIPNE